MGLWFIGLDWRSRRKDCANLQRRHRHRAAHPTGDTSIDVCAGAAIGVLIARSPGEAGAWGAAGPEDKKDLVPPVLTALLGALLEAYPKLPSDSERRKTWIYEVPLVAVHHLRETLNAVPPMQDIPDDVLAKYDAPVIASAVKLWVLELDPPLGMYEGWDDLRKLYPTGAYLIVHSTEAID